MDTPEYVIEMLLKIEEMYRAPATPQPLGKDFTPSIS